MGLRAVARIRLERPLALHISAIPSERNRTVNVSERLQRVSMQSGLCYSLRPSPVRDFPRSPPYSMRVWSLPKVFHTCGKSCGNRLSIRRKFNE
jgi:hypothetical protein